MTEARKDVLQPLDADARRLAQELVRSARFGALATLTPEDGLPAASRVIIATDYRGRPGILISQLSGHFRALEADARCSLLLGEPGKGDPLAHPRVTVLGTARRLATGQERDRFRARFLARHPKSALYADFGDFAFWLVEPTHISLNGGFGKAYEASGDDILSISVAADDLSAIAQDAIEHMNDDHADAIDRYATAAGAKETGWTLATLDTEGLDLTRGDQTLRIWFDEPLRSADQLRPALMTLARQN